MKILVCGSRTFTNTSLVYGELMKLMKSQESLMIIEGGCRGPDTFARMFAEEFNLPHVTEWAEWEKYGKRAGPIRNQVMLEMKPDLVLAFVDKKLKDSRGTYDMVKKAMDAGIEVMIVPDIEKIYGKGIINE